MKITNPDLLPPKPIQKSSNQPSPVNGPQFNQILTNTVQKNQPDAEAPKFTNKLQELQATIPLVSDGSLPLVEQTTEALDLFDDYIQHLNDPNRSLRDLAPKLNQLIKMADEIQNTLKKNPANDSQLTDIITDFIFTAKLEEFKFNRGDYLA